MARAPRAGAGAIVAAVLLPPLGVYLANGLGSGFWITALLTLLGWIPGVVFALVTILRPGMAGRA